MDVGGLSDPYVKIALMMNGKFNKHSLSSEPSFTNIELSLADTKSFKHTKNYYPSNKPNEKQQYRKTNQEEENLYQEMYSKPLL